MSNINIDVLGNLDSKIKEMTTTLTDGKNLIKEDFTKTETNDYVGNLYTAKVSRRVSTKFDEKKVLKIVKENGLDWLLTRRCPCSTRNRTKTFCRLYFRK